MANPKLTPRERQLLTALAKGLKYSEIAEKQYLATCTVKSLMRDLYRKLGAANGAHAVHIAWQRGLLGPSTTASTPVGGEASTHG